jgi:regulator of replication initiation timing
MKIFGYQVPLTRDPEKEIRQLQAMIASLQKEVGLLIDANTTLRQQNNNLRMDVITAQKTLDEYMGQDDAMRRSLQQQQHQVIALKRKLEEKDLGVSAHLAQMRALVREQTRKEPDRSAEPAQNGDRGNHGAQNEAEGKKKGQAREQKADRGMQVSL